MNKMSFINLSKRVPKSFEQAILDNPERFAQYLDFSLWNPKKPKQSFIEMFYSAFEGDYRGQSLLKHALHTKIMDVLWKSDTVQSELKGRVKRLGKKVYSRDLKKFFDSKKQEFQSEYDQQQKKITAYKAVAVSPHFRGGKRVSSYKRGLHFWTPIQKKFIKNRLHYSSNEALAVEFNKHFKTAVSKFAVRDMKYRLGGRK